VWPLTLFGVLTLARITDTSAKEETMPIVRVELWKGATKETKAKLAKAITNDVATIANKRPQNIIVLFTDYEKEDWAIGGELASDIDWSKK
jgi:4-oxalocrotonate tautomerase